MCLKGSIFSGFHASHVAFIQAIKQQVDLILLLYRFETNTTSKRRCPKCCWLSLPFSLWCLPSINQPGSHWTHDPSPCGMMRPSLVFSCIGEYTQCQVLEQPLAHRLVGLGLQMFGLITLSLVINYALLG